ncbi:rRNA maturation RNase YbeY [Peribacillus kribbensis]|uniref:rRNA maturation RNase YbeY n=1 Tax=Peribacillus kribbensis TaxID=356658 RepID=UPI000423A2E1|nr:rRNA maturation RNase YbeY [Peribacillus kribbensis]
MILTIDYNDETHELQEKDHQLVDEILQFAAGKLSIQQGTELSVTFVDNDTIQKINAEYRDKDQPTDVISFALEEMGEDEVQIVGGEMPRVLGDIVISVERTREQAEEYQHSFERELGFLALHGFLHLLGYDHMTEEDEKIMFGKQKEILDEYGLLR